MKWPLEERPFFWLQALAAQPRLRRRSVRPVSVRPASSMPIEPGSGTTPATPATPTLKPYQFSATGLVHEMLVKVPMNCTVPSPSVPITSLPETVIELPPYSAPGPPETNTGVAPMKLNEAVSPPWPRLQIENTGLTTACENVIVSTTALPPPPPIRRTMPLAATGALATTVPSANVADGPQLG